MAIEWPTQVCPAEMSWGMVYNNRDFSSTLNNSQQIVGYPGSYWKCSLSLPQLTRDRDRIVTAFMGRLQGASARSNCPRSHAGVPITSGHRSYKLGLLWLPLSR